MNITVTVSDGKFDDTAIVQITGKVFPWKKCVTQVEFTTYYQGYFPSMKKGTTPCLILKMVLHGCICVVQPTKPLANKTMGSPVQSSIYES